MNIWNAKVIGHVFIIDEKPLAVEKHERDIHGKGLMPRLHETGRMFIRMKIRPDCYVYTVPLKNAFT